MDSEQNSSAPDFSEESYQKAEDKFDFLLQYFFIFDHKSGAETEDTKIPIEKWAFDMIKKSLSDYYCKKLEYNHEITLDKAFGIPDDIKTRIINKRNEANKRLSFTFINSIRFHFGLNIKDAVSVAAKLIVYMKNRHPGVLVSFRASAKSLLDAYYRAYPQHVYVKWAVEEKRSREIFFKNTDDGLAWFEKRLPETATFIKRKMRLRNSKTDTETTCGE